MALELDDRGRALENEYFHRREKELLQRLKERIENEAKEAVLKCPRCDGKLFETEYNGIVVDVCDECTGVWLDAGELVHLAVKEEKTSGWLGKLFG
jgi:uncharacterized protein